MLFAHCDMSSGFYLDKYSRFERRSSGLLVLLVAFELLARLLLNRQDLFYGYRAFYSCLQIFIWPNRSAPNFSFQYDIFALLQQFECQWAQFWFYIYMEVCLRLLNIWIVQTALASHFWSRSSTSSLRNIPYLMLCNVAPKIRSAVMATLYILRIL